MTTKTRKNTVSVLFQGRFGISIVLMILILNVSSLYSQAVTAPAKTKETPIAVEKLVKDIDRILKDKKADNALWGIYIQSLKTGEILYDLNAKRSFLPASNMKLITAAAALSSLGPSFVYTTELYSNGKINKKILKGDLIIRGAGDPTFGSTVMFPGTEPSSVYKPWVDTLLKRGVEKIEGNIIIDDTYFTEDVYPMGWSLDDVPFYYAAQSSALCFADNVVSVSVAPNSQTGSRPFIAIIPETEYIEKTNTAVTVAASDSASRNPVTITRELGSNEILITGEISKSSTAILEQITVESPSRYAGTVYKEELEYAGITVTGGVLTSGELKEKLRYNTLSRMGFVQSPALSEIVKTMNKRSNNLFAEQILRTVAKETNGIGDWKTASEFVQKYLGAFGITFESFSITDGSGLSRMDMVTPEGIVVMLRAIERDKKIYPSFVQSLPMMGVDGTLSERLKGTSAEGKIAAKTGGLTGVRSLAGYCRDADGQEMAFCIIANNFTSRTKDITALQDSIALCLANFSRK